MQECDAITDRPGRRGETVGRVFCSYDPEQWHYLAVPFCEAEPATFKVRWEATDYVRRVATGEEARPAESPHQESLQPDYGGALGADGNVYSDATEGL